MSETIPNFFMVGAPKCGTSAMYSYLNTHPNIFLYPQKEPNFFSDDLKGVRPSDPEKSLKQYLRHFNSANTKIIGEGSTWYLYSQEAAYRIKKLNSSSKILIMLRNPIEQMYSLHSQLVFGGLEKITNFEKALLAEKSRKEGSNLPSNMRNLDNLSYKRLLYTDIAKYCAQVERYLQAFPSNQVKIVIFDEFKANPKKSYLEVLDFLELDHSYLPDNFKVINSNKVRILKGDYIQKIRTHPLILAPTRALIPYSIRRIAFKSLGRVWTKINTRHESRQPINPELKNKLISEFTPEVKALSNLIDKDLSHWIEV